jgi:hypothetical protein
MMGWAFEDDDGIAARDSLITAMDLSSLPDVLIACDGFGDFPPSAPSAACPSSCHGRDPQLLVMENATLQATIRTLQNVREQRLAVNGVLKKELGECKSRFQRAVAARSLRSQTRGGDG